MPPKTAAAPKAHGKTAAPVVDFVRASHEHTELAPFDQSNALTTSTQGPFEIEVPTGGYFRSLLVHVDVTGGAGGNAVAKADAPWKVFSELTLHDVGGQDLIETIDGFEAYLIHKYGGYAFAADPTKDRNYGAMDTSGNFSAILRLPVAVGRDGLGAMENENAAQAFRLRYRLGQASDIYSTSPTTLPTVRVRATYESWARPATGETPPHLGVVQNWSKQVYNVNSGNQTIRLTRVGANIRNLILVFRDSTGARTDAGIPDQLEIAYDNRPSDITLKSVRQFQASERYGYAANGFDTGVEVIDFTHENGHPGLVEQNDLWLPTSQASKIQLKGSFQAAGTLTVLTNDIIVPADVAAA